MSSEGYIGVSNNLERRFKEHIKSKENIYLRNAFKKYKDCIIMEAIFSGSRDDCLKKELYLRPSDNIGWNKIKGGGDPPHKRKHSNKTKKKISKKCKERINDKTHNFLLGIWNKKTDEEKKKIWKHIGDVQLEKWNFGNHNFQKEGHVNPAHIIVECPYCSKSGGYPQIKRCHFDNCKLKL